jgi:hypothetical protein
MPLKREAATIASSLHHHHAFALNSRCCFLFTFTGITTAL